jgi:hypothetical protein
MSTSLNGKFIANTFQKVLQYDENDQYTYPVANFDIADLLDSKYTLLNGAGQALPGIAIDHTDQGNGGLYIKETDIDSTGAWGIQIAKTSNNEGGLNFWRPFPSSDFGNYHLFLKNTRTVFVGYTQSIPTDVFGTNLYVNQGIRSGIYNGFNGFPNSGRQSNYYTLGGASANKVLQLGNNDEIFSSGTSLFNGPNDQISFTQSIYCQESIISGPKTLPYDYPAVRFNWIRVGRVVNCSFWVTNIYSSNYIGESGNLQRIIIPLPVTTERGYSGSSDSRDPIGDYSAFGSGAAYIIPDNGGGVNNNYGTDRSMQACEVKLGGHGGEENLYVTVSWNYEGSSGVASSIRGSFTYPV